MLTNGLVYQFYSDLDEPNKLDKRPFLILDLLALREDVLAEASKMTKGAFDVDEMLSTANALKYQREIRTVVERQIQEPEEEFVRFFYSRVAGGRFTQSAKEEFTPLVRRASWQLVGDRVSERLRNALATEGAGSDSPPDLQELGSETEPGRSGQEDVVRDGVVTTDEELEGFRVVRAIACGVLPAERITYRDAKTYFAILCDDNNRKPICRLWFNTSQKYVGLLDGERNETRHPIDRVPDIYQFAEQLRSAAAKYAE